MNNLFAIIPPSQKLRDAIRVSNERLPVSYEAAKRQVDLIQRLSSPKIAVLAKDAPTKRIGF